jgi:hypothetical protein
MSLNTLLSTSSSSLFTFHQGILCGVPNGSEGVSVICATCITWLTPSHLLQWSQVHELAWHWLVAEALPLISCVNTTNCFSGLVMQHVSTAWFCSLYTRHIDNLIITSVQWLCHSGYINYINICFTANVLNTNNAYWACGVTLSEPYKLSRYTNPFHSTFSYFCTSCYQPFP